MKNVILSTVLFALILLNTSKINAQRQDSIDVLHYKLEVSSISFSNQSIAGKATLTTISKFNGLKSVVLDLQKLLVLSTMCNNSVLSYSQTDSTAIFQLDKTYNKGDTLVFKIEYSGKPVKDARWGGFFFVGNYAFNMGVGMASNPPNYGRCWYPCIDNFTDRATYEFHITTDTGYMAVCNGLQEPATQLPGGLITWHWRLGQEIPTYIANVAVSKYVLINSSYAGIQKNIPVVLAVAATDTAKARASFVRLNQALQCFEDKFGPYLFDRVGYVAVPFNSGAMEHAGNISYPIYAIDGTSNFETLMAHELAHHWWGNLATTQTASDMWLNEGWASYCEALFLECVYGKDAYNEKINNELFESLRWAHVRDGGYLPVSGVPLAQTYGTHVYTKGSLMVHSLRMLINNDTAFFNTCKSYLAQNKFVHVSSQTLQSHFEKRFGGMITSFFQSYIYDKGHVDLQLTRIEYHGDQRVPVPYFKLMSRYKTVKPDSLRVFVQFLTSPEPPLYLGPSVLIRNPYTDEYKGPSGLYNANIVLLNTEPGTYLGTTTHIDWIKGNTTQTLPNVLLTLTPKTNFPDSSYLIVQHHFARPYIRENQTPKGIRISSERYWHINGYWKPNFQANAFFNYDGTTPAAKNGGFLDNELITGTEDSLVLLYRKNPDSPFTVVSDLIFQPGGKTDKTGRFIVNNLAIGDYVFGYRDFTASINEQTKNARELKFYPNPVDGIFTVQLPSHHGSGRITLYQLNGATVLDIGISKKDMEVEIDTTHYSKGLYYIRFEDEKGEITSRFLVK